MRPSAGLSLKESRNRRLVRTRSVLIDHDSKFGNEVLQFLRSSALKPRRTTVRSPWQNGVAQRWVGSARRELLDHIIPLNEYHFRRLGRDYLTNTIKTELTLAWTRTPLPNEPSKGVLAFKP